MGSPTTLLVGGLIIAAIVGVAFFAMNNGSKGSPGSSGSPAHSGANNSAQPGPGSIVFSPATISCPSQPFATTIHLPSSLKGTDTITYRIDDTDIIAQTVAEFGLTQQPDGTWSLSDTNPNGSSHCDMGPGAHIARLVDASGKVLAQGSFTFVMSATPSPTRKPTPAPTPTPAPLAQGSLTFAPASMSCSADSVSVILTVRLPASIAADAMLTSEIDGDTGSSARTDANFTQQPDGSWLSTGPTDSSSLCGSFDQGAHTFRILDADGNVLAEGSFTLLP